MRSISVVIVFIGFYAHSLNACSSKNLSDYISILQFSNILWFNESQNFVNPFYILGNAKENSILCRDCKFCSSGSGDESKPIECKQSDGKFSCFKRVEKDTGNHNLRLLSGVSLYVQWNTIFNSFSFPQKYRWANRWYQTRLLFCEGKQSHKNFR